MDMMFVPDVQRWTNLKKWLLVTIGIFWSVAGCSEEPKVEEPFEKVSVSYFAPMLNESNFLLPIPHVSMQIGGEMITSFVNFALPSQQGKLDEKFVEIMKSTYADLNIKYEFKENAPEMKHFEMPDNLNRVTLYDKKIEYLIEDDGENWSRTIKWSN